MPKEFEGISCRLYQATIACKVYLGVRIMKTLDRGAVAVAGVGELPDMALASAFRDVAFEYEHGFYVKHGKRMLDIVIVLLSLPFVLPLVTMCALALWVEGGLPFYRQKRIGQGGRVFHILKLRTMVRDADGMLEQLLRQDAELRREWDETQKLKDDPRITAVGRFLRATSLDELPQLWNVLVGHMSLVGARPMMVDQLSLYGKADGYCTLRPGITGPWQVGDRNATSFRQRAVIDELYCREVSLAGDLHILIMTLPVILRRTGC